MLNCDEQILRILGEATEPMFALDIAERLTDEPVTGTPTVPEVIGRLKLLSGEVAQLPDGRWIPKRRAL